MKPKLFFILLAFAMLYPRISFGAQYPAMCPVEAQGILNALGGCKAVDCSKYSAICAKCGCSGASAGVASKVNTINRQASQPASLSLSSTNSGQPNKTSPIYIVIISLIFGLALWGAAGYGIWHLLIHKKPESWMHKHALMAAIIITIVIMFAISILGLMYNR